MWNQRPSSFCTPHCVHCPPGSSQFLSSLSPFISPSTFHSTLKTLLRSTNPFLQSLVDYTQSRVFSVAADCLHKLDLHNITRVAFRRLLYPVRDYGTLCLDCCMTLATTLLAMDILWRHSFSQSTSAYSTLEALATMRHTNLHFTFLLFNVTMTLCTERRLL